MVTLRMLGIAVALLVAIPIGIGLADHTPDHVIVQGGEVVNAGLEAGATVTDIVLLDPTFREYDTVMADYWPEQLVEGHTVFVVLESIAVPNVTNWTAEIVGSIHCETDYNTSGSYFGPIPIPRRINRAHAECEAAGIVFVTPDPFINSSQTSYSTQMEPNGNEIPFVAPNGVRGVATEYSYEVITTDPWTGQQTSTTWYAWSVPIIEPWTHEDLTTKSWFCPIPVARIHEMGVTHFTGWVTDTPPDLFPSL